MSGAPFPRDLPSHPCWPYVRDVLQIESGTLLASGRQHRRIELSTERYSNTQIAKLLAVRVQCAACGCPIAPFRKRHGKSAGRAERPGRLFLSVACELKQSVACARGSAASAATEALAAAIRRYQTAPVQPKPALPHEPSRPDEPNQLGLRGVLL